MTLDDATEAAGVLADGPGRAAGRRAGPVGPYRRRLSLRVRRPPGPGSEPHPGRGARRAAARLLRQAVAAGATLNGLVAVRNAVLALSLSVSRPSSWRALLLPRAWRRGRDPVRRHLHVERRRLAALAVFSDAVGAAQDWALDNHLSAQYQAPGPLGAAVARDLQARAAPLPRLTTYGFPRGTSSLVLAYRLYGDASRADELRAENAVSNPAFMPATGTALSE